MLQAHERCSESKYGVHLCRPMLYSVPWARTCLSPQSCFQIFMSTCQNNHDMINFTVTYFCVCVVFVALALLKLRSRLEHPESSVLHVYILYLSILPFVFQLHLIVGHELHVCHHLIFKSIVLSL